MKNYTDDIFGDTPQNKKMRDDQVQNRSGGHVWEADKWTRLRRFLVIGTEGGTFYATGQELTKKNYEALKACTQEDAKKTVDKIVEVSDSGEAIKNNPAIFAITYVLKNAPSKEARSYASSAFGDVIRTGTHLFQAAEYVQQFGGWGRATRRAFSDWYHDHYNLAYHLIKYRQRNGWTHRDVMRLAHPSPQDEQEDKLFEYAVDGWDQVPEEPSDEFMEQVWAFEKAKHLPNNSEGRKEVIRLIKDYDLPRECVPNEFLNFEEVWDTLLRGGEYDMPLWAMMRNLGKMTSVGLLDAMSEATQTVVEAFRDQGRIQKARLHPLSLMQALSVYKSGVGMRGSLTWTPATPVVEALEDAFELAFDNVEPTGERLMLALDVSGSMARGNVGGLSLTPRQAEAGIAYITARTESRVQTMQFNNNFAEFPITRNDSVWSLVERMKKRGFDSTNCSLPMQYALKNNIEVDAFVVYTDCETNTGRQHPKEALDEYRNKMGIDAKLIVVGMTANRFSIADPEDSGMLDVVGCSTSTPSMINRFVRGEI